MFETLFCTHQFWKATELYVKVASPRNKTCSKIIVFSMKTRCPLIFLGVLLAVLCVPPMFAQDETPPAEAPPVPTVDVTPDANGNLTQEQMEKLLSVVADRDDANDKILRNYTYIERDEDHKLDSKGNTQSTESKTYEVLEIYGTQVRRQIEKNDKPLDQKEADKEEAKLQKVIDERKNESESKRKKRAEEEEKQRAEDRKFVHEIANAYNFKLVGTETLGGRDAWVISGEPRPGFESHVKYGNLLPKFHGRVWIDKADLQMAKLDLEAIDTVSLGLFLARLHKGSRVEVETTRVNDEVWLPQHVGAMVDVRLALLKEVRQSQDQTFRDYKKFRTSAKIVGYGEVKEPEKK